VEEPVRAAQAVDALEPASAVCVPLVASEPAGPLGAGR
jgi:hypothetical protein